MKRRLNRAATIVEVTMAAGITMVVLFGAISTFLAGATTWMRGQGRIDAGSTSQRTVREVSKELREAMAVTVDADGMGLTYRMPQFDANGAYVQPTAWDGVARRIFYQNGSLIVSNANANRTLTKFVTTVDPNNNLAYRVFTPGSGAITRSLTIEVVTQRNNYRTEQAISRSRETVFLRNIPQLTK